MKVAQLASLRRFELVDRPLLDPAPGELQVRVAAVGICGSDMHNYGEGGIGGAACQYPQVLGHEPSGVVVKAGAGVTGFSPGDRGSLEPSLFCYHCHYCMHGRHNLCPNMRFTSSRSRTRLLP